MSALVLVFLSFAVSRASAQQIPKITLKSKRITILDLFKFIKSKTGLTVFYTNQLLDDQEKIKVDFKEASLETVMDYVLKGKNISWIIQDQYVVLKKNEPATPVTSPAQKLTIRVQGTVTDEKGAPVQGASVVVKGMTSGAITGSTGSYALAVPDDHAILVFSHLGFETQERSMQGSTMINVTLKQYASSLNDVVILGYGSQKKKDLTGSVGIANTVDMQKAPVASYVDALAGRVAGLNVVSNDGQPGAGSQITVRGASVTQDASPLFVIDGFPIENMDINSLNPNEIESLQVLKDASSIAIYGARGSNGVIVITTKRGKNGAPRLSFSYSTAVQDNVKRMKLMDPYNFVLLQLQMDSLASTPGNPVTTNHQIYLGPNNELPLDSYKDSAGIDWQKEVMQPGLIQNYALNLSAGNGGTRYSVGGSLFDQKGIIINTGMKRYEGRFTLDQDLGKYVKLGITTSYSSTLSYGTIPAANAIAASGYGGGVVQGMWQYRPVSGPGNQNLLDETIDSLDLAGFDNGTASSTLGNNLINPKTQAQNEYRHTTTNTGIIDLFLEYTFLKKFKLRISGGFNETTQGNALFYNSNTQQGNTFTNAAGAVANTKGINGTSAYAYNKNYLSENLLTYATKIGSNQTLEALAGFTYQYATSTANIFSSINIPASAQAFGILSLGSGTPSGISVNSSQWQLYSFLSRINYTIKNRYLFTVSARADGSSEFAYTPQDNQWGYFPSGAFGWRFTDEPFMNRLLSVLDDGKLRVSYGEVGNNRVGDYSYLAQFAGPVGQFGYPLNNTYTRGTAPFFMGNSALKWETSKELDLGTDLSFFQDRLSTVMDYYDKQTNNFLLNVQIPVLSGYAAGGNATQYQNTGGIDNRGFELTINTVNVRGKHFGWTSGFNISWNKSKILSFYSGTDAIFNPWQLAGPTGPNNAWIARVGGPVSEFYGYKWGGVYQYKDFNQMANGNYVLKPGIPTYSSLVQPGDPKYKDLNGDGVVDANDETTLGSSLPVHTGGFSNNFTYNGFSLNIFLQWSYGNKILNGNDVAFNTTGGYFTNGNQFASYEKRWTPENPTNSIPRAMYNVLGDVGSTGGQRPSSRFIEDGSFLRLKTIYLGYRFSGAQLKQMKVQAIDVYTSAQNILTLTRYSGIDPEVSTYRVQNSAASPLGSLPGATNSSGTGNTFVSSSSTYTALVGGFDYTPYPRAFTLTFGINITF